MSIYLHGFRQPEFGYLLPQAEVCAWMREALLAAHDGRCASAAARFDKLVEAGHIASRRISIPDFAQPFARGSGPLFKDGEHTPWHSPGMGARMRLYMDTARSIFEKAFPADDAPPDLLAQTTCTGYEAPTAAQRLVAMRGWHSTRLLQFGHMGCYAALPTTAALAAIVRDEAARNSKFRASMMCLELCSLHLQVPQTKVEQIVIHYLFGDGAVRFDLSTEAAGPALEFIDHFETIVPDTRDAMTWTLSDTGFRMTLARDIPEQIAAGLPGIVSRFLSRNGLYRSDVKHWAIHPGGTRIIEQVAARLELDATQTAHSHAAFRRHGNISSATVASVWDAVVSDEAVADGALVASLAFGPGLTVTGNLLRKVAR